MTSGHPRSVAAGHTRQMSARGAPWVVARSAGEILALAALFLSAVALVVVLDDADAPGSLREQVGLLLIRLAGQANLTTAIVLVVARGAGGGAGAGGPIRDQACMRADRLMLDLGTMSRQVARLEASLASRDELLLAVVHELRVPLTHVVGYAELLSSGSRPRHPQEIGEMSAAIQSASTTMLRLMDDLVEATRAQADGFSLKARPVDLVHLIRGVVAAYDAQGQPHRLRGSAGPLAGGDGRSGAHPPGAGQPADQRDQLLAGRRRDLVRARPSAIRCGSRSRITASGWRRTISGGRSSGSTAPPRGGRSASTAAASGWRS